MMGFSEAFGFSLAQAAEQAGRLAGAADEDLMAAFRASADETAFEELFRRHLPVAFRTAHSILGEASAAEDALQEVFLRVVRARRSYRPGSPFAPWFYAILRNACRDELRAREKVSGTFFAAKKVPDTFSRAALEADPATRLAAQDDRRSARAALEALPHPEREVLALRINGGLGFAEIGAICGITSEAAKKRAYRGLARLRRALAKTRR